MSDPDRCECIGPVSTMVVPKCNRSTDQMQLTAVLRIVKNILETSFFLARSGGTTHDAFFFLTRAHGTGPKTVFFWAPMMKWCLVIAGVKDLNRPADKLSVSQNLGELFRCRAGHLSR